MKQASIQIKLHDDFILNRFICVRVLLLQGLHVTNLIILRHASLHQTNRIRKYSKLNSMGDKNKLLLNARKRITVYTPIKRKRTKAKYRGTRSCRRRYRASDGSVVDATSVLISTNPSY